MHAALTACLHQEQLMATISLLWKANFCWKPWTDEGKKNIIHVSFFILHYSEK